MTKDVKELSWRRPVITAFPQYAHVLAVIGEYKGGELWLLSHCVQLQINRGSFSVLNLDFCVGDMLNTVYHCPYLSIEAFDIEEFTGDESRIVEKIMYYINQGKYVYLPVDWFYIPAYECYGRSHAAHDILVLGYDDEKKEFIIADFFGDFRYEKSRCKYLELIAACRDAYKLPCILKKVLLLKPCEQVVLFDIKNVKSLFEDYLRSRNSNRRFLPVCQYGDFLDDDSFAFGLNVYQVMIESLESAMQRGCGVSIRSYAIMYEHKILLGEVCSYMADKGYLQNDENFMPEVDIVREQCLVVRNLLIKYNMRGDKTNLVKSIKLLKDIRNREEELFEKMINNMKEEPVLYRCREDKYGENYAEYVGEDRQTLGNWIGKYGDAGYDIFLETEIGRRISIVYYNFLYKKWSDDWTEGNALYVKRKKGDGAFAACKYFRKNAYIDILIRDGLQYMLSIYVLAWWKHNRRFCIRFMDGDNKVLLCSYEAAASDEGIYINFLVSGHVRIEFENRSTDIGVISGMFFSTINADNLPNMPAA